jgi:SAM-dependent methyltransferase
MFLDDVRRGFENVLLPLVPPKSRVLDLCCGTGQLAHWLTGCGFRVTGLDGSAQMIGHARRNAPRADFLVADARSFHLPNRFDLIVSVFDSLNHLPDVDSLSRVFANVYTALAEGGLFFFDLNFDHGFRCSWNQTYSGVEADQVFITRARYNPRTKIGKTLVTLFRPHGDVWVRDDVEIVEYCYDEVVVRERLADTGFDDIAVYDGSADLGMPRGEGRRFFLTAKGKLPRLARGPDPRARA